MIRGNKDAEKNEEHSAVWFVTLMEKLVPLPRGEWARYVQKQRNILLDTMSFKDGHEAKGCIQASKLNARLCLAFSTTYSIERCRPTASDLLDWRGMPWTWCELRAKLAAVSALPEQLRQVLAQSYKLQVASYKLQAASCKLQAASCNLQVTSYELQVTGAVAEGERARSVTCNL